MKVTIKRTLPIAAAAAVGALLTGAVAAGTGDGQAAGQPSRGLAAAAATGSAGAAPEHDAAGHGTAGSGAAAPVVPLSRTCADSDLPPHDGNQIGPACVSTPFGEVGAAEDNPQLLITDAPDRVAAGQPFTIKVSTRNLVRDRFLAAAQGGYYLERSSLDENGLVRGHFHTACRVLDNTDQAPQPERQAVFVATEDGAGGATPDTVTVKIPGLPTAGEAQCATWAGDGSHRMPMMVFANQIPAFDSVRIQVTGGNEAGAPATAGGPANTGTGRPAENGQRAGDRQPAENGRPVENGRRSENRQPAENPQPAENGQRARDRQPAENGRPAGDRQRTENGRRSENRQPAENPQPAETPQPAENGQSGGR